MKEIKIVSRFDDKVLVCGKYESLKECCEKNKADLRGAKNYLNYHAFFQEVIRIQKVETFTTEEWACIGQIIIHTLCWDSIKKRFNKMALSVFEKCTEAGYDEWEKYYKELE